MIVLFYDVNKSKHFSLKENKSKQQFLTIIPMLTFEEIATDLY